MAEETVKEFLVSIGWKTNEGDHAKFERMIEHATLRAKLLGDALEEMARKGFESVQSTAERYESLFFSAERMHTSVQEIQALQYAFSQLGGTASGAQAVMEKMAAVYQRNPGSIKALEHFGAEIDKVTHKLVISGRTAKEMLGEKDSTTVQWAGMAGLSEEEGMFIKRHFADIMKYMNEYKEMQKSIGFNPDEGAKKAEEFKSKWNEVLARLRVVWDSLYTRIAGYLVGPLEKLNEFFAAHQGDIVRLLKEIANIFVGITEDAIKGFEAWLQKPTTRAEIETFFRNAAKFAGQLGEALVGAVKGLADLIRMVRKWAGDDDPSRTDENALPGKKVPDAKAPPNDQGLKEGGFWGVGKAFGGWLKDKLDMNEADTLDKGAIKTDGMRVGSGNPLPVKLEGGLLTKLKSLINGRPGGGLPGPGGGGGDGGGGGGLMGQPGAGFGGARGGWGSTTDQQIIDILAEEEARAGLPPGTFRGIYAGEGRSAFVAQNGEGSYNWGQFYIHGGMGNEMLADGVNIYDNSPAGVRATARWLGPRLKANPGLIKAFHGNRGTGVGLRLVPSAPKAAAPKPIFKPTVTPKTFEPAKPPARPLDGRGKTSFNQNVKVHVVGGEPGGLSHAVGAGPRNTAADMAQQFNSAVG